MSDGAERRRALVVIPRHLDATKCHPGLVVLPGYGQALRGDASIYAWRDDYGLLSSYARLRTPPVTRVLRDSVYLTQTRQKRINDRLLADPFQGLVLICPFTPIPYYTHDAESLFETYASWLVDRLLPEVRHLAPLSAEATDVGLAGVSMGGYVALEVVARRPDGFGAFTAIQSAIEQPSARALAERIQRAFEVSGFRPTQILTSNLDPYRAANEVLHQELSRRGLPVRFDLRPGTHNAAWMWELGSLETLFWHDRVLHAVD